MIILNVIHIHLFSNSNMSQETIDDINKSGDGFIDLNEYIGTRGVRGQG